MRNPFNQYKRLSLVPLAGIALAAYSFFVLARLAKQSDALDAPLRNEWHALGGSLDQSNTTTIDFSKITNRLAQTRQELDRLRQVRKKAAARLEFAPSVRQRLGAPFQLVEWENERGKELDDLARLAKQQKVEIDPAVFDGFPTHRIELREPALLWPALALVDGLLVSAIHCKVTAIHSIEVPLSPTNPPGHLASIPLQVELSGPAPAINQFLHILPLRTNELQAAGLPQVPLEKPPLFIERLAIRRQSPDKPDEVRVWLRAVGFVLRE